MTYDGDILGGLLPLADCPSGTEVVDIRQITLTGWPPGQYEIAVGIYNRLTNERFAALASKGMPLPDNILVVATLTVP